MSKATILELKNVKQGQIGFRRMCLCWWLGPLSKLIGIQIGHFRINLNYDRFDRMEDWPSDFTQNGKSL